MYSKEGEDAILNWVRTLTSGDEPNINDLGDLANGKIMAQILNRLEHGMHKQVGYTGVLGKPGRLG